MRKGQPAEANVAVVVLTAEELVTTNTVVVAIDGFFNQLTNISGSVEKEET